MERKTIPEMSRCRREGRHNCPIYSRKISFQKNNKVQLIKMLSQYFKDDGNEVIDCSGDADSTICHTALDLATTGEKQVILIADDTDIFDMLIYHFQQKMCRGWNVASLFPRLDKVKGHILFVHAMTVYDTTSAPYGKGKKSFLNQILKSKMFVFVNDDTRYMGRTE